jgi:hypothetical protein
VGEWGKCGIKDGKRRERGGNGELEWFMERRSDCKEELERCDMGEMMM